MKIKVIAASNGKNLELAKNINNYLLEQGNESQIINLVDLGLPLYTPSEAKENSTPKAVSELLPEIVATEAFFFVAPEYNGGTPPTLTNFLAWISTSGDDWRVSFNEKRAALATHSGSGGLHLFNGLRIQLCYIGMHVIGRSIHTHYKKELNLESMKNVCDQLTK